MNPTVLAWALAQPAGVDLVVLPGGFSHGDYLRCGAMAAQSPIMGAVYAFVARGGQVLGVCNGFQILTEVGLLPGALLRNASLRFLSMVCHLRVERAGTPFTAQWQQGDVFRAPMAHGDGNYFCDDETLARQNDEGLAVCRNRTPDGRIAESENGNGACDTIAGFLSRNHRVRWFISYPEDQVDRLMSGEDGFQPDRLTARPFSAHALAGLSPCGLAQAILR